LNEGAVALLSNESKGWSNRPLAIPVLVLIGYCDASFDSR